MDHTTWTTRKFWLIAVGVFVFGLVSGASAQEPAPEPEVVTETKEVEVVKEVEVPSREDLNRLDAVDQQIFTQSGEVIDAQSKALEIAGAVLTNLETVTVADLETASEMIDEQTARIELASAHMERLRNEREAVLTE